MKYFYLQVDRLDETTLMPAYFPMGSDPDTLDARVGAALDRYRNMGFQIVHYPDRPTFKTARRAVDGIKLEIIVIQRDQALPTYCNLDAEDNTDDDAAIH